MTQQHEQPEFDDPALKTALRHAYQGERAPTHLRQRIVELMLASPGQAPAPASSGTRSRWRMPLGAKPARLLLAACIALLAIGVAAYQIKINLFPQRVDYSGIPPRIAEVIPETFALEMVQAHESCAKLADHHLIAGEDAEKLQLTLSSQVKVPVAVVNLAGWQFKGAGMCKVGEVVVAHLLYSRSDGRSVSIFEMPVDVMYAAPEGAKYSQVVDGHAISGFRHSTGLYCVVGSGGAQAMTMPEVEQLRGVLQTALPAVKCDMMEDTSAIAGL